MNTIKLGLIQMRCGEDPQANLAKVEARIREAAAKGAQIISVSELFLSLYFCQTKEKRFFDYAEPVPGPLTEIFSKWAKELGVVLVGSVYEKGNDGRFFNTAFVVDADGKYLGKYRKIHIPNDVENYIETYYFSPGDLGTPVFKTRFATIGVLVCWDQWYTEPPRALALKGAEIIFYPTAIGFTRNTSDPRGKKEHEAWQVIQRGHAVANTVFVAVTNRTGQEGNINFWGTSFVADPMGTVLAKAPQSEETNLIVECDLDEIQSARADWPFLTCRRPDAV